MAAKKIKPIEEIKPMEIKPPNRKPAFSKEKLISMKRYRDNADLLTALLEVDKTYTFDVVDALIDGFLNSFLKKGTVK